MNELKWYELNQNNSYGVFDVDDKLCCTLIIQAESEEDAIYKAEELGCYWYGVEKGIDCPCCGDRWSQYFEIIDIEKYKSEGRRVLGEIKKFSNIEEYAQYMADKVGWTNPNTRIYYADGKVSEIFGNSERCKRYS